MVTLTKNQYGNFICVLIKYSLGYGFKIYYKEVKRGKDVARNFVYFRYLQDCKERMLAELMKLETLESTGVPSFEAWYNSYKA